MKTGKTINELAISVANLRNLARDYRAPQNVLTMDEHLNLATIEGNNGRLLMKPTELMNNQLAEKLGVPVKYYNRMMTEAPQLLRANVNEWLGRSTEKRFIRTLVNPDANPVTPGLTGRAFLGNGYKPLDNYDMLEALLPALSGAGLALKSSEVTEKRLYMQMVTTKIEARVNGLKGGVDDRVQLGLVVSNSEVGCGVLVYRLVCTNGMIVGEDMPGFRKVHVGSTLARGDDASVFTDETKRLTDAAVWAQAKDAISAAVNQTNLDRIVERLNGIAQVKLANPEAAVELVSKKFDLLETERTGVMRNLIEGGDVTQWVLTNAVTALANEHPSYDRVIDLETIGGKIAAMPAHIFGSN